MVDWCQEVVGFLAFALPAYEGRRSTTVQPTSYKHTLSLRSADNPSTRYHPPRFYLWTRMRVIPYKTEKDMLPEPLFSTPQKSPLNETHR